MNDISEIQVEAREGTGKGAARQIRRDGRVPAVVYGLDMAPRALSLGRRELEQEMSRGGFMNRLYNLRLEDKIQRVLPRDVQFHVVTDTPIHVDFLRLSEDAEITIAVPVVFVNEEESPGLRQGGVLNVVRYEIEVDCRADSIPESIEIDLTGLELGDSLHISAVTLPEGATSAITDRDFTIITVAVPSVQEEEVEEEEKEGIEGVEGEVPAEGEAPAAEEATSEE